MDNCEIFNGVRVRTENRKYENRCASCKTTTRIIGNGLTVRCDNVKSRMFGNAVNFGKGKCRHYEFGKLNYCGCGEFIGNAWNYCSYCGALVAIRAEGVSEK